MTRTTEGSQVRVLVVTEDDDIGEPLEPLLRRAGHAPEIAGARGALAALSEGPPPAALLLDGDLPPDTLATILEALAPHTGAASFPLIVLGGPPVPVPPAGWHEDACARVSRPPEAGEIVATLAFLRRLGFYRRYRDLVHDLAQPVMTLHALAGRLAGLPVRDEGDRRTLERLGQEAERLMTLMETFQKTRALG